MSTIRFETKPIQIGDWTILRFPERESSKLPSRGMTLVEGTVNGFPSKIVLEPDGKGSHWFNVDSKLRRAAKINANDKVKIEFKPSKDWPEPEVPSDLKKALTADKQVHALWMDITPMARWDWIRWIRSTKNRKHAGDA